MKSISIVDLVLFIIGSAFFMKSINALYLSFHHGHWIVVGASSFVIVMSFMVMVVSLIRFVYEEDGN